MSTHTEEEAQKHWCPEARVWAADGANRGQRHGDITMGSLCIASKCMAWRWWGYHDVMGGFIPFQMAEGKPPEGGDGVWLRTGYCGKAGRP